MPTAAEIIAQLNALPDEEHAAAVTALQNDAGAVVKAFRSKVFAAGKREGAGSGADAAAKLTEAQERITDLETELADVKAKTPDAKAIEEAAEKKWKPKLDAATKRADDAESALRQKDVDLTFADFLSALTAPAEDGTQVDPEWAKDVARNRWGARIAPKDGGGVRVLHLDGDTEYEAPDAAAAVRLLAADARKTVPARYVIANADTGAGVTSGGGGRSAGGYDPVKAGQEMAAAAKANAETNALAFR